jgi:hypothetical protein
MAVKKKQSALSLAPWALGEFVAGQGGGEPEGERARPFFLMVSFTAERVDERKKRLEDPPVTALALAVCWQPAQEIGWGDESWPHRRSPNPWKPENMLTRQILRAMRHPLAKPSELCSSGGHGCMSWAQGFAGVDPQPDWLALCSGAWTRPVVGVERLPSPAQAAEWAAALCATPMPLALGEADPARAPFALLACEAQTPRSLAAATLSQHARSHDRDAELDRWLTQEPWRMAMAALEARRLRAEIKAPTSVEASAIDAKAVRGAVRL